jgi:hypothetical protein
MNKQIIYVRTDENIKDYIDNSYSIYLKEYNTILYIVYLIDKEDYGYSVYLRDEDCVYGWRDLD